MRLQIDATLRYRFARPNIVLLTLKVADGDGQRILREDFRLGDAALTGIAGDDGVGERIWARLSGTVLDLAYSCEIEITRPVEALDALHAAPLDRIPARVAPYLRASRYCHSDKFVAFVRRRFGHLAGGAKVAAIRDWIEAEFAYVPGSSDADTDVLDTFAKREGVCRDYAHLMCAMARAAGIPARMVAAYSPDIVPPDFHATTEVWLDDAWHLVDATGMSAADSTALIAVGRDAYDIAFMDSEAPAELVFQSVRVLRA